MIFTLQKLPKDVKKLGFIGTLSYVGAFIFFRITPLLAYRNPYLAIVLAIFASGLLIFAGLIYLRQTIERAIIKREALGVLREVYNRLAEASSKGSDKQTVSITMTIAELPKKIIELTEKL